MATSLENHSALGLQLTDSSIVHITRKTTISQPGEKETRLSLLMALVTGSLVKPMTRLMVHGINIYFLFDGDRRWL